jgi:tripartite-type tricarboxylate transporter receptor subunit TctC
LPRRVPYELNSCFVTLRWHGIIGPKGIPVDVVAKLNKAINESLSGSNMETELESDGLKPASGSPDEFGTLIRSEIDRWGKLVKARNIRLD